MAIVTTSCPHDCSARCLLRCHVEEGVIRRIDTDEGQEPQLRACARGRAYRQRVYHPQRLLQPLVRTGERGEGRFRAISWEEALARVAHELTRVKEEYGNAAIWAATGPGSLTLLHSTPAVSRRFFNLFGGATFKKGGMSGQAAEDASHCTLGVLQAANAPEDILNSRLILLWSWNSAEVVSGCNTTWLLAQGRDRGISVIVIDPRLTDTGVLADEWVPIYPGTDAAMMVAMAYVMLKENLQDQPFLDRYTLGFDRFRAYVMGEEDGQPKTAEWAAEICGVPAATIARLARLYASLKPAALLPGRGMQRAAYGEQSYRAAITLAAMTGNVGVSGGSPAAHWTPGSGEGARIGRLPTGTSPLESVFPTSKWADALLGGEGGYPNIKMVYSVGSNFLNQLPNINKGRRALSRPEAIICHEQFLTPTARFADIVLPVTTHLERCDICVQGEHAIFMPKVIEPLEEARSDLEIFTELAELLGLEGYNGRSDEEWLREFVAGREIPSYEELKERGVYRFQRREKVAFRRQVEEGEPFPTPSGKIEIYSQRLEAMGLPGVPAIPKYVEPWEGRSDPLTASYPIQLITTHGKKTANSVYANLPWLLEVEPHSLWINPLDAASRGIEAGDRVRVFNSRGQTVVPVRITERIMPGVVSLEQGFSYEPGQGTVDYGGSANVLTRDEVTRVGWGGTTNSCLVQVCRYEGEG